MTDFDFVIIGSGFGGSLLSIIGKQLGLRVLLLELGTHPRFAIGESTSPLANVLLEELARKYAIPELLPLCTWGTWQRDYPQLACGLKRGFTFYNHRAGQRFSDSAERKNQLLVAASPCDEMADTHWFREEFDQFLVQLAQKYGAEYRDGARLTALEMNDDEVRFEWSAPSGTHKATSRFIVDAGGLGGALSKLLDFPSASFPDFPETYALYSHFTGVRSTSELKEFQSESAPPYPPDSAALHHVFENGWMWILRFNNGITSAGVSMNKTLAEELDLSNPGVAWQRMMVKYPSIGDQFAGAQPVQPFRLINGMARIASQCTGNRWALLPSAAGFVDPLFSTGIPMTLLGIQRLSAILPELVNLKSCTALAEYGRQTLDELQWVAAFIAGCIRKFPQFADFTELSMAYFAAASFSELANRLDRSGIAPGFLLAGNPQFRLLASDFLNSDYSQCMSEIIAPINVAGLCDPQKKNWYGVDLQDVILNAGKLGYDMEIMRKILASCSWAV